MSDAESDSSGPVEKRARLSSSPQQIKSMVLLKNGTQSSPSTSKRSRESSPANDRAKNSPERGRKKDYEEPVAVKTAASVKKPIDTGDLVTRTGGAYIPPARLAMMRAKITDKSSAAYQRLSWEALKKSIHGLVNKINKSNIGNIVRELFRENLIRGRGLLTKSLLTAQASSPTFTHVFSALVAIINTKFPSIGELVLKHLITDFKRAFKRNQKDKCLAVTQFVAHLVNQEVAHEIIALEILALLLEQPTNDSVEVAVGFIKEVGEKMTGLSPRGIQGLFDRLRNILNESAIDKRVQYMIEVLFQIRKDRFKDFPAKPSELDLVEEEDQFTHMMSLDEVYDTEESCNVFRFDPDYLANEEKYIAIRSELLGDEEDASSDGGSSEGDGSEDDNDKSDKEVGEQTIIDNTETNLIRLRRAIYLVIQSSLDFEEAAHKLMKLEIKPGQEYELCNMIMDCCAQLRTYEKFFGLLAQRFCQLNRKYVEEYEKIFAEQYNTIHRLELVKLRNVARFFSHLLHTDAISWGVLQAIRLNEDDTTSSSRIFIKILFQELSEYMGLVKLNNRLKDPTLQVFFDGILPRDNPRDSRFSINFFTSIGLGGLTVDLREFLTQAKTNLSGKSRNVNSGSDSDSSDSDSSSSEESSSDSDSSSSDDSSDDSSPRKSSKHKKKISKKTKSSLKSDKKRKVSDKRDRRKPKINSKERITRKATSSKCRGYDGDGDGNRTVTSSIRKVLISSDESDREVCTSERDKKLLRHGRDIERCTKDDERSRNRNREEKSSHRERREEKSYRDRNIERSSNGDRREEKSSNHDRDEAKSSNRDRREEKSSYHDRDNEKSSNRDRREEKSSYRDRDEEKSSNRDRREEKSSYPDRDEEKSSNRDRREEKSSYPDRDEEKSSNRYRREDKSSYRDRDEEKSSYRDRREEISSYRNRDEEKSSHRDREEERSSRRDRDDDRDRDRSKRDDRHKDRSFKRDKAGEVMSDDF